MVERKYVSVADESRRLGVSERTLERAMRNGEIPFSSVGGRILLDPVEVDVAMRARASHRAASAAAFRQANPSRYITK